MLGSRHYEKKRISISSTRFFLVAILSLLFLIDIFALWYTTKLDYERTMERARVVLQGTSISLEERIKRTVTATEAILHNNIQRIQDFGMEKITSSEKEWERFRRSSQSLPDAGSLWLLDEKGNLILDSTNYPSWSMNFSHREYFGEQRDKKVGLHIGPIVKGKITEKYSFIISHRVDGSDGKFLGIILAGIETDDFTNFLRSIEIGKGGTVTVFRTDGSLILRQPMEDKYLGKNFLHLKVFAVPFDRLPAGIIESTAIDGTRRLVAYRKMQGLPLLVTTGIPIDSILEGWRNRFKTNSILAVLVLLALIGLSVVVRKTTSREEKEKSRELSEINEALQAQIVECNRAEAALKESGQRWATTLASIGDGVIATDDTGRITFMNAMAERLTGWTLDDASMKPVAEIFNIINGKSTLQIENPVAKVLREGVSTGLAAGTILIRRDGTKVPIDDSCAPMRDGEGNNLGVVLAFRDITERKQAEEALQESEERLRFALETIHTGAFDLDLTGHTVIRSLEHDLIFGYARLEPQWTPDIFLEHVLTCPPKTVQLRNRGYV